MSCFVTVDLRNIPRCAESWDLTLVFYKISSLYNCDLFVCISSVHQQQCSESKIRKFQDPESSAVQPMGNWEKLPQFMRRKSWRGIIAEQTHSLSVNPKRRPMIRHHVWIWSGPNNRNKVWFLKNLKWNEKHNNKRSVRNLS